jgi:5-methylcytosine-specific restriction endonuclease McrA
MTGISEVEEGELGVKSAPEADRGAIAFAEKLLTLLDRGSFVATYKYAVLLGLMDLCLEHSTAKGAAPTSVTTTQLAAKVLDLYWPQTKPFAKLGSTLLRQNSGQNAEILSLILDTQEKLGREWIPLSRARARDADALKRLARRIEWKLVEMPLPRLQSIGIVKDPFIYQIGWDQHTITKSEFNDPHRFDNSIRFMGDAAEHLVRLAGLLRPLIQRQWAAMVARLNSLGDSQLEAFLFGVERIPTVALREPLRDLQSGRCFYCGAGLQGAGHIDHFVPWARYPDNGIENLVVAHEKCNSHKSDHLAAVDHVERWVARMTASERDLADIAQREAWERRPLVTKNVARAIYLRLPADAKLWRAGKLFVDVDGASLARVLVSTL